MPTFSPSGLQRRVLSAVYRLTQELAMPPSVHQTVSELAPIFGESQIRRLVQYLIRARRLMQTDDGLVLTDRGLEYLHSLEGAPPEQSLAREDHDSSLASPYDAGREMDEGPIGFDLHIVGEVKAGQVEEYELRGDVGDWLTIPKVNYGNRVFGYRVVGKSMEQEGLFEGDYVIVEGFESGWPKQNEMIVTRYLPEDSRSSRGGGRGEDAQMVGPTVKIFAEIQESGGPVYRLSWKRARGNRLYEIRTHRIAPIGRVIGVYRPIVSH